MAGKAMYKKDMLARLMLKTRVTNSLGQLGTRESKGG